MALKRGNKNPLERLQRLLDKEEEATSFAWRKPTYYFSSAYDDDEDIPFNYTRINRGFEDDLDLEVVTTEKIVRADKIEEFESILDYVFNEGKIECVIYLTNIKENPSAFWTKLYPILSKYITDHGFKFSYQNGVVTIQSGIPSKKAVFTI